MSWDIPTGEKCPTCGEPLVKTARGAVKCSGKDCDYRVKAKASEKSAAKSTVKAQGFEEPPFMEEPPVYDYEDDYYGQED